MSEYVQINQGKYLVVSLGVIIHIELDATGYKD